MKEPTLPKMTVLPDATEVPIDNLRRPPTRYTHRVIAEQPYYFDPAGSAPAGGILDPGTRVALLAEEGNRCRVVDSRGLSVYVSSSGLEKLATSSAGRRKS